MTRGFLHSRSIRAAGAKASAAFLCLYRTTTRAKHMARPTKYEPGFAKLAEQLCRYGATDFEVARELEVNVATLYRWRAERPEFREALKNGKAEADDRVEKSLYARAVGYQHDEVDIRVVEGQIVQTPIVKQYPPDTAAAFIWLKNRKSQEWRDKQDIEHSGGVTVEITRFGATKEAGE